MKINFADVEFVKDFEFDYSNLEEQLHAKILACFGVACTGINKFLEGKKHSKIVDCFNSLFIGNY